MRISLLITVVILLVAAWIGVRDRLRLVWLHEIITSTEEDAIRAVESSGKDSRPSRKSRDEIKKALTEDLLKHLRKVAEWEEGAGERTFTRESRALMDRIVLLDASSFMEIMSTLRDVDGHTDSDKEGLIQWCMAEFAKDHPQDVLAMIAGGFDFPGDPRFRATVVNNTILHLARQDVQTAVDWLQAHGGGIEGTTDTKYRIIGALGDDPQKAFRLMRELDLKSPYDAIDGILYQNQGIKKRSTALEALRGYLSSPQGDVNHSRITSSAIRSIGSYAARDGFEEGSGWITDHFTKDELSSLSSSTFLGSAKLSEAGRWLEWLESSMPWDPLSNNARQLMSRWTQSDPEAAGNWIVSAKDGPARSAAIEAYAVTIAPHEPETAARWVMQLPPEKQTGVLRSIHISWPSTDPAGAAAFAEKHGLLR